MRIGSFARKKNFCYKKNQKDKKYKKSMKRRKRKWKTESWN